MLIRNAAAASIECTRDSFARAMIYTNRLESVAWQLQDEAGGAYGADQVVSLAYEELLKLGEDRPFLAAYVTAKVALVSLVRAR